MIDIKCLQIKLPPILKKKNKPPQMELKNPFFSKIITMDDSFMSDDW